MDVPSKQRSQGFSTGQCTICVASNDLYGLRASDGAKIWGYPVQANMINSMGETVLAAASTGEIHALRV